MSWLSTYTLTHTWRYICQMIALLWLAHKCCGFSVIKSCPTLPLHGLQHARLPCPSLSPRVCSNSCPLSWWCHSTISSSVVTLSLCSQSFPASGSFSISWLFESGGQSVGASASVLPMNIQGWFPLGLTGLVSLLSGNQNLHQHQVREREIDMKLLFYGQNIV